MRGKRSSGIRRAAWAAPLLAVFAAHAAFDAAQAAPGDRAVRFSATLAISAVREVSVDRTATVAGCEVTERGTQRARLVLRTVRPTTIVVARRRPPRGTIGRLAGTLSGSGSVDVVNACTPGQRVHHDSCLALRGPLTVASARTAFARAALWRLGRPTLPAGCGEAAALASAVARTAGRRVARLSSARRSVVRGLRTTRYTSRDGSVVSVSASWTLTLIRR